MAPADWTKRERESIDEMYRLWKRQKGVTYRAGVVISAARGCGDLRGDPDTWIANRWEVQIARYYRNRECDETGRPRRQTKTREQIALLEYAFAQTSGWPYTGELLALTFLSGLQFKQVQAWFPNRRRTYVDEEALLSVDRPYITVSSGQDQTRAVAMSRYYREDPKEYARSLIMCERCVCTGWVMRPDRMQFPRPDLKKYWTRMFPEDGDERSLLEVTEELEGDSDDDSMASLTQEEIDDMLTQSRAESL